LNKRHFIESDGFVNEKWWEGSEVQRFNVLGSRLRMKLRRGKQGSGFSVQGFRG